MPTAPSAKYTHENCATLFLACGGLVAGRRVVICCATLGDVNTLLYLSADVRMIKKSTAPSLEFMAA